MQMRRLGRTRWFAELGEDAAHPPRPICPLCPSRWSGRATRFGSEWKWWATARTWQQGAARTLAALVTRRAVAEPRPGPELLLPALDMRGRSIPSTLLDLGVSLVQLFTLHPN